ncbi:MAG: hypothetical protein PHR35_13530, partial [Kiritimatiellae bacterium]|nr:hypothetical protein [Kiritimatiellia bacterium]
MNQMNDEAAGAAAKRTYAHWMLETTRRRQPADMPAWLKRSREAYGRRLLAAAEASFRETGIWFLARGASRDKDEQETVAVWVELLNLFPLESLPGYSEENHRKAIAFWQSWQNRETGRLYN